MATNSMSLVELFHKLGVSDDIDVLREARSRVYRWRVAARSKAGALLGLECTYMALLGYGLMTLSPVENAHLTVPGIARFIYSESPVFIGGLVTGPLFGWFGQQWRVHRAWAGALPTAGALCFEPLARLTTGHAIGSRAVLLAEVAAGIAMAAYIVTRKLISSPARPSTG